MPAPLSDRIVASTVAGMERHDHTPGPQAIASYSATAEFIQAMADGTAPPVLAVATGPTGSGKTEEVCAAVRELLRDPQYSDVGVLVLVSTLRQIVPLIERMQLQAHQYAVKVGTDPENDELNNMGLVGLQYTEKDKARAHHYAQVMFTTQAKLKHLTTEYGRSYKENTFFEYRGPVDQTGVLPPDDKHTLVPRTKVQRRVILWDEAFLPIDPLVVSLDDVRHFAYKLAALGYTKAAEILREWAEKIDNTQPAWDTVPIWIWDVHPERPEGMSASKAWNSLKDKLGEGNEHDANVAEAMFVLNNKNVRIELETYKKTSKVAAISFRQSVPHDIEPLLVFDADGDKKMHYRLAEKWRGNVRFLPPIEKTYRHLTIRYWDRASGHIVYRRKADVEALADVAARAVMEREDDKVLIVHRLGKKAPATTLPTLIASKVASMGGDPRRLHFMTWGSHKATNEYCDVRHLIVVGVHQAPLSAIIGLVHGTLEVPMTAKVSHVDVQLMRMSEIRSDLLQAVGRGASRNMINGDVPRGCSVDLIASSKGPMAFDEPYKTLAEMFPGARIEPWEPNAAAKANGGHPTAIEAAMRLLDGAKTVTLTRADWAARAGYAPRTIQRWLNDGSLWRDLAAKGRQAGSPGNWAWRRLQADPAIGDTLL